MNGMLSRLFRSKPPAPPKHDWRGTDEFRWLIKTATPEYELVRKQKLFVDFITGDTKWFDEHRLGFNGFGPCLEVIERVRPTEKL